MAQVRHYTEEEKGELLSNPYTARVSECNVMFTLAFKKFVMENIDKPDMTSVKVFSLAGYRESLIAPYKCRYIVKKIRDEAKSEKGLQEPKVPKHTPAKKKHVSTEIKELENRVKMLEQQVEFLKKSRHLKMQNSSTLNSNINL